MSRITTFCDWLLRSPIIWGAIAWVLFDTLMERFGGEWLNSYFTESPLHRITTALFMMGMAALVIRGLGVLAQFNVLNRPLLAPMPAGGQQVGEAAELIESLDHQPSWLQSTYLVKRLHDALEYVVRRQSADGLESQLRSLEEADYNRMSSGYAMVRVITGVVPILGFLGTVVGITIAIARLSPEQLESSLDSVIAGLSVAFDTTALALALSIILVFSKLIVEGFEDALLTRTGKRAYQELVGRFEQFGSASDPQVATVSRMCDQVVRAVEVMAARQADLWKSTIDDTHHQWAQTLHQSGENLVEAVSAGLQSSLQDHAAGLTEGVESQLVELNAKLNGQAETLSDAVRSQADTLSDTVRLHTETLSDTVRSQTESLSGAVRTQTETLAAAVQQQIVSLNETIGQHGSQLDSGATELLGNLRVGLERMAELLVEALEKHGETLTKAEEELASENRRHLSEVEAALGEAMVVSADRQEKLIGRSEQLLRGMQEAVAESAGATVAHQEQLVKQGEVLLKVVESTGQVKALQDTLNQNLDSLNRGHNLEETLLSLSAAIQLLSARAGRPTTDTKQAA